MGFGVTLTVVAQDAGGTVWTLGQARIDALDRNPAHDGPAGEVVSAEIGLERNHYTGADGGAAPVRYAVTAEEGLPYLPANVRVLAAWPESVAPLTVAPPGKPTAVARADPAMAALVRRTLRLRLRDPAWFQLHDIPVPEPAVEVPPGASPPVLSVEVDRDAADPWPLATSWAVSVRDGADEFYVGRIVLPASGRAEAAASSTLETALWRFERAGKVDVILRPDPEAAERSVGVTDYWDGGIELNGAAVVWQR